MANDQPVLSKTAIGVILVAALLICGTSTATAVFLFNRLQVRTAPTPTVATTNLPLSEQGLLVTAVFQDGAAAQAGLRRGDILLQADETTLTTAEDLQQAVRTREAGEIIDLLVLRGNETAVYPITVAATLPRLGLEVLAARSAGPLPVVSTNTPAAAIVIDRVLADSPAAAAGLLAGDVITAVDGQRLIGSAELINLFQTKVPGDILTLTIARGDEVLILSVTLSAHPDATISYGYLGIELAR